MRVQVRRRRIHQGCSRGGGRFRPSLHTQTDIMLLAARRLACRLPSRPALGACHLRAGRALSSIKLPDNFFDEISEGARPQEKVRPLFLACCSSSSLSACDFFYRARRAASTSARRRHVGESCSNSLEHRIRHVSVEREPLGGSRGKEPCFARARTTVVKLATAQEGAHARCCRAGALRNLRAGTRAE